MFATQYRYRSRKWCMTECSCRNLMKRTKAVSSYLIPPLKLPIKKKENRKNAVFRERDIPTVSKSVEIATSNDVTNFDRFSEHLQLPVHDKMIHTQLSSSPVKPKRRATPIQAATLDTI